MGKVGSKSRSLGQIFEKILLALRGHSFDPIFLKLAQNVCLDDIRFSLKDGRGWSKSRSLGPIFEKSLLALQWTQF